MFGHLAGMSKTRGAAEAFPNPFATLWQGAREALRMTSYYEMKDRAGIVGRNGLGPLLTRLQQQQDLRVHLMGYSFGAHVAAFGLSGLPGTATGSASAVKSLMLIQGAFSHFSFAAPMPIDAARSGALAGMGARADGPLLATFSAADRAVGWWYPAASMLSHSDAETAHDLTYRWGGMGHDAYQQADTDALTLLDAGSSYALDTGRFYQVDSNRVISANQSRFSGAHSDIRHPEVAWLALTATTRCDAWQCAAGSHSAGNGRCGDMTASLGNMEPTQREEKEKSRAPWWRSTTNILYVLGGAIPAIGFLFLLLYALSTRGPHMTYFSAGVLVGLAAFLVGCLVGFLFGIPRVVSDPSSQHPPPPSQSDPAAAPMIPTIMETARYRPSTNLDEVSDWLTKLLLGAGLVQLGRLGRPTGHLLDTVAHGLQSPTASSQASGIAHVVAGALVLLYLVIGFLDGYVLTTLWYQRKLERLSG